MKLSRRDNKVKSMFSGVGKFLPVMLVVLLSGCFHNTRRDNKAEKDIVEEAAIIAENYAAGHLKDYQRKITPTGNIMLSDSERGFIIEKNSIKTGFIDNDRAEDAIVTVLHLKGDYVTGSEHLILLSLEGKLTLIRSVESDMKILNINNGIITAKVPTHPRSSPLFNCESCQEIQNFRFVDGDLVKTE
ncbi:MAG: hypothetical protein WBJ37_13775 [Bacteroidales bacterium]